MRLHEFVINEDSTEQQEIIAAAKFIADYLIKYRPKQYLTISQMAEKIAFPPITSGVLISVLFDGDSVYSDRLALKLNKIRKSLFKKSEPTATGLYSPLFKTIDVSSKLIKSRSELVSVITHELQHAVDAYKSNNRIFRRRPGEPVYDPKKPWSDEEYAAYLLIPSEVNARFSQALYDLIKAEAASKYSVGRVGTTKETVSTMVPLVLAKNKITPKMFSGMPNGTKKYQRLLSRAYKFYDEVKHTIEAEPDEPKTTLISRLKQLIPRFLS